MTGAVQGPPAVLASKCGTNRLPAVPDACVTRVASDLSGLGISWGVLVAIAPLSLPRTSHGRLPGAREPSSVR